MSQPVRLTGGRPPTPAQRPLLASQRRFPTEPLQNMALVAHIDAAVDPHRLADAFASVVAANRVLRSRWPASQGGQRAVFASEPEPSTIVSLDRTEAERFFTHRAAQPLDLERCCYDSCIAVHPDGTVSWFLNLHHVITDATSSVNVWRATEATYHGSTDGEPRPDYFDHVAVAVANPRAVAARSHWEAEAPAPRIGRLYQPVEPDVCDATRTHPGAGPLTPERLAPYRMVSDEVTLTAALATATAAYLHRITGSTEFALGIPVHNRRGPEAARVIGPLMEVFPLAVTVSGDDTFADLHRRLGRRLLTMMRHAAPGAAGSGRYEAVVNVIPQSGFGTFGDVAVTTDWLPSGSIDPSQLVRVQYTDYGDNGRHGDRGLVLDVSNAAADAYHAAAAPDHFARLLAAMLDDPSATVGSVDLVTETERRALNRWEQGPDGDPTFSALARMVATLNTDRLSIRQGERVVTGAELRSRIRAVVEHVSGAGVEPGQRVAIEVERSIDAVIAIVATLLAGAAYVPIDPAFPEARRRSAFERARCRMRIDAATMADLAAAAATDTGDGPLTAPAVAADDDAYLLFTSGSTGTPKAVPITHRGLNRYLAFAVENYGAFAVENYGAFAVDNYGSTGEEDLVVGFFGALTFDLTVTSLFLPFLVGGEMVVLPGDGPAAMAAVAADPTITWLKATPSHLDLLVRTLACDHRLSMLVVGGEAFSTATVERVRAILPGVRVFNEYGPTEAVVGCMIHESPVPAPAPATARWSSTDVPIGVPAPEVELRVVDADRRRVPIGVAGELMIRAEGQLTRYPDDEAANTAFVDLDDGRDGTERFYASGDLVRLDRTGSDDEDLIATYLGRIDEQMKVGGIRLDPTEVEAALTEHPWIDQAAVRLWSPAGVVPDRRCERCGIADNVPGIVIDDAGICSTCHAFDRVSAVADAWFGTPDDLAAIRDRFRAARRGDHDCLHLLSGGKDSTYALYRLVEAGFEPYVLTLDNGYISSQAKDNIARTVADLGLDHEFAGTEHMNAIFRDSLERYSNVCQGCYKTIYTLATTRAVELGIPAIVTGLSRGQLFETRLIPQQFDLDRFDPAAIDAAVVDARRIYHQVDDGPNRLLDTTVFDDPDLFDRVAYLDLYRYLDVPLTEMLSFLDRRAPWVRPTDTGRSTNCLINDAGIHTHLTEQGYHNYAIPYAWDVRLGHKTRAEAIEELNDHLSSAAIDAMLADVGYTPTRREVLTAWYRLAPDADRAPEPAELRTFLGYRVPSHAIPSAFVAVEALPLGDSGKLDQSRLPAPTLTHRRGSELYVAPTSEMERRIISVWERVLRIEPIGRDDHFFELGGDSLAALEATVTVSEELERELSERLIFLHPTPRLLAEAVDVEPQPDRAVEPDHTDADDADAAGLIAGYEPLFSPEELAADPSPVEQALLVERERLGPATAAYNVGHLFTVDERLDAERLVEAARDVAAANDSLRASYGSPRRRLERHELVELVEATVDTVADHREARTRAEVLNRRPFDLVNGPLVRLGVWHHETGPIGTTVWLGLHHVSVDAEGVGVIWSRILDRYWGGAVVDGVGAYRSAMADALGRARRNDLDFWRSSLDGDRKRAWSRRAAARPTAVGSAGSNDGFVARAASVPLAALSALPGVTPRAVMLAALDRAVASFTGGPTTVGLIASLRAAREADPVIGYFLNTLPFQFDAVADGNGTASGFAAARSVQEAMVEALAHRHVPFARIAIETGVGVDALLSFQDTAVGDALFNGVAVAPFTLFAQVETPPDGDDDETAQAVVWLSAEYRGAELTELDATRLVMAVAEAATAIVEHPDRPLVVAPPPPSVIDGPELVTSWSLNALADWLSAADRSEMSARAEAIGSALVAHGVGVGDRVALRLDRSADLVASVIATLAIGASYVPVDPTYPPARIERLLAVAQPTIVVDDVDALLAAATDRLSSADSVEAFARRWFAGYDGDGEAYLILTSGSTGVPKGVAITRERLERSTAARLQYYGSERADFCVVSSFGFDSSVAGLFWALATGGTVVLPPSDRAADPEWLARLLAGGTVTHTLMVPTLYRAVLAANRAGLAADQAGDGSNHTWPSTVVVAGEACGADLVDAHHAQHPDSALYNEYGPTEATVWATVHRCEPGEATVPIGRPIPGASLVVVDPASPGVGQPVPAGVIGELRIDSPSVHDGSGRYRTGDVGYIADGLVHFLGRNDEQLNRGGLRIELGEIEAVARRLPGVADAVARPVDRRPLEEVVAALDPESLRTVLAAASTAADPGSRLVEGLRSSGGGDADRLVLFVATGGRGVRSELERQVWDGLAESLPGPALPDEVVVVDVFPRTANGKIDLRALTATGGGRPHGGYRYGGGERPVADPDQARRIAAVFAAVVGRDRVEVDDSFFDVGGHSLLLVPLTRRLADELSMTVTAADVFRLRTPAALSGLFSRSSSNATDEYLMTIQAGAPGRIPLFGVHVLGADGRFYRPLAAALGPDRPVHGLGLAGAVPTASAADEVEQVAAAYAAIVAGMAPEGRVALAAVSVGATVAFELAEHLNRAGIEVVHISLFDAEGPTAGRHRLPRSRRAVMHARAAAADPVDYTRDRVRRQLMVNRRRVNRAEIALRRRLSDELPTRLQQTAFVERNVANTLAYDPPFFAGDVTVFKAADERFTMHLVEHGMGWADHVGGELDVPVIAGGHLSILDPGNVDAVARRLRSMFERAESVEAQLVAALANRRLDVVVPRLLADGADGAADADDRALIESAASTAARLAAASRAEADRVVTSLLEAGLTADLLPVPDHVGFRLASVLVDDEGAVDVLAASGYRVVTADDGPTVMVSADGDQRIALLGSGSVGAGTVGSGSVGAGSVGAATGDAGSLGIFLSTPRELIPALLSLASLAQDDVLVDVGCGDGRVVVEAAVRYGVRAIGVERDGALVEVARKAAAEAGVGDLVEIVHRDVADSAAVAEVVAGASVVFAFLPPDQLDPLVPVVLDRLGDGGRLVAHEQLSTRWSRPPDQRRLVTDGGLTVGLIWHG